MRLLFVATLVVFALTTTNELLNGSGHDMTAYHSAGIAVRRGISPYDYPRVASAYAREPAAYIYPPLLAMLFAPVSVLPFEVVRILWMSVNVLLALYCARLLGRLLPWEQPCGSWLPYMLVFVSDPLRWDLGMGQANIPVLTLILLAMRAEQRGDDGQAGAWLGLAAAVKVAPLLLALPWLLQRRWRASIACGATLAASCVAPLLGVVRFDAAAFSRNALSFWLSGTAYPPNQSLRGVMLRLFTENDFTEPLRDAPTMALWLSRILSIGIVMGYVAHSGRSTDVVARWSAGIVTIALASTITWEHHLVMLFLPLCALAHRARALWERSRLLTVLTVIAAAVAWLELSLIWNYGKHTHDGLFGLVISNLRFYALLALVPPVAALSRGVESRRGIAPLGQVRHWQLVRAGTQIEDKTKRFL